MQTINQRLSQAVQLLQAGRASEAESLFQGVLREDPKNPHALHLLGLLMHQTGKHQEAIGLITRALKAHGPHPNFHSNLASVYLAVDDLPQSETHSRQAIRLNPALP